MEGDFPKPSRATGRLGSEKNLSFISPIYFESMEHARGKKWKSIEKSRQEYGNSKCEQGSETEEQQWASSQPSTSTGLLATSAKGKKRKRSAKDDQASCPKEKAQSNDSLQPQKPIPPLPSKLPPVNRLHQDILRAWCQQLKISFKGQKLDAYRRLCASAYPNQKNIPTTAKEARIESSLRRKLKMGRGKASAESPQEETCSERTNPPEVAPPPAEAFSNPEESAALLEGVNTIEVTTSAPEAVLASWARIASVAGKMESAETAAVESPQEAYGVRWCVVHGRSLPANKGGWVHLQLHAGQAWVPEKQKGRVCALFLLPACSFPPPHLEDNMLCPKCVQRNKVLMKSLQWD
ncbi:developmental pluripotency-associated protein 4 [Tupaia chinensis]|uniref:Developmental pluripotency-associated protein 4 n=1 Tax=Tupaia chinensis TaxID=246437 RepID=L9KIJ3_TUPCH|nr:developmental pluripotency-associated protein 4 [Tupaia chinensis]ELW62508.1 Developmental pluripotency-associated protein 4 [Tupaia chinensis]